MVNLVGVVNKPQFDTDIFAVGKAIHLRHFATSNGYKLLDKDAIITKNNKLEIVVSYYDTGCYEMTDLEIEIGKVISEEYELTLMKEDK